MLRRRRYVFNYTAIIRNYSPQHARSARVCAADESSCRRRRRTSLRSRQVQRSCSAATSVSSTYSLCKQRAVGLGPLSSSAGSTATYSDIGCNSPIDLLLLVRLQPSARHCLSLAVGGCSSAPCERGLLVRW